MARIHTVVLPSLRHWRAQRGYTQARLASRIGMRRNTIWWIEAGHPTRARTARQLAVVLGVQVADLERQPPAGLAHQ
jgi:transcriptional regulator with XRE-family HTH domain